MAQPRASDIAYERLREMIVDLRLPPGCVVNEQELATALDLGRMPVREAIARLATDRFITVHPRRSTLVTAISLEDTLDMFDAREVIECGVARIADDHEIHAFLVHMMRNPMLDDAASRLLQHNLRFWRSYWSSRPAKHATMVSHADLLAAVEEHSAERAEQAMREHIAASRRLLQASF